MAQMKDCTGQSKSNGISERRRFYRISMSVAIEVGILAYPLSDILSTSGSVDNISNGGIAFGSSVAYETGAPLSLKLRLKGWEGYRNPFSRVMDLSSEKPFTAIGEVVWCRPSSQRMGYDVGIRFLNVDESDYKALTDYLRDHESPGARGSE